MSSEENPPDAPEPGAAPLPTQRTTRRAVATGRLDAAVRVAFGCSGAAARRAVHSGKIKLNGQREVDPAHPVKAGAELCFEPNAPRPLRTEPLGVKLVYRDDFIIVLDKPAGLLSAPFQDEPGPTALDAALLLCRGVRVAKVVHRLDKLTSGLLVFARSSAAARAMREAIDAHEAKRTYHCVVAGVPLRPAATIVSDLVTDRGDGYRGSAGGRRQLLPVDAVVPLTQGAVELSEDDDEPHAGRARHEGKQAVTRYRTVASAEGRTALEVRIETGRTHQIRIHLAEIGHPVLGEQVYARNGDAPRQALHAARLAFPHPHTGQPVHFFSPWPQDLARLRPLGPDWRSAGEQR